MGKTNMSKLVGHVTLPSLSGMENSTVQITMYWRPGCGFCSALKSSLNHLDVSYDDINIWDSPDAAAFVRSVANGNEVVPTVTVGSVSMVNPSAQQIVDAARQQQGAHTSAQ